MFDKVYEIAIASNSFAELKKKIGLLFIDAAIRKNGFFVTVGAQLAIEGRHDKVKWMRRLGADAHMIACGYALVNNHDQVEFYRKQYHASVNDIAYGYAVAGNQAQAEFYRKQYHASVDDIVYGYAQVGNHDQVEFYRNEHHVNVNTIAYSYARAGNHDKVAVLLQ